MDDISTSSEPDPSLPPGSVLSPEEARRRFVGKLLLLVEGSEGDITSESVWDKVAVLVIKHWEQFEAQQGAAATLKMLGDCAQMKLKIRLAKAKTGSDDPKAEVDEFERLMASVFAAEEG